MEQIVVKLEDQNNGEILLYYVDENGENQEGVLTTVENIENPSIQLQDNSYILGSLVDIVNENSLQQQFDENEIRWTNEDLKRLLTFYSDNKLSFLTGTTQRKHLWAVACKTILIGKNQESCETKLEELRNKYGEVVNFIKKGVYVKWPYYDICHAAFADEETAVASITEYEQEQKDPQPVTIINKDKKDDDIVTVRHMHGKNPEIVKMLKLYLKYKKDTQKGYWRRDFWEKIANEMGETDSEYIQKRFLNYKHHYIGMLEKRKESPSSPINWPYMELFDKIFEDDAAFHKKNFNTQIKTNIEQPINLNEWDNIQITVLAKYYHESYEEFEDPTIPDKFLWTEVGRLIDKTPDQAKSKFESMKEEHLNKYISGNYNIDNRVAVSIIYDHIIAKDVKKELSNKVSGNFLDPWKTVETDELVQFIHENSQLFRDSICHFVCWAALSMKLKRDVGSVSSQWRELTVLYNSILEDKKENPDMQIDWRYIDLFDLIFNYGMDVKFLKGFEDTVSILPKKDMGKVAVKKLTMDADMESDKEYVPENSKTTEPRTDPRSTKILEFYLKNKEKTQYMKNKVSFWDPLAKEIGFNSSQCANRFRYLKQAYSEFVQKEIKQPKVPITWPYYALCKKVFGYRSLKNKLKNNQVDNEEWSPREEKEIIKFFSNNFHEITNNIDNVSWAPLATQLGKTELICKEKFVELRKCYRKLKTMRRRNSLVKISWSYFDMFDKIYTMNEESVALDTLNEQWPEQYVEESMEEDDYQCIIVLPEGQDISTINNSQLILPPSSTESGEVNTPAKTSQPTHLKKWTKRTKKLLLIHYINYIRLNRGKEIVSKDMWKRISGKFQNKSPANCRKMFFKLKNNYKNSTEETKSNTPFSNLLEKVLKLNPKFTKTGSKHLKEGSYENVKLPHDKIYMALTYYLEHIEEFANPKFDKNYVWKQLADHISEPVTNVYNKVNYLKETFEFETEEINGQKTEFSQLLKEIVMKEVAIKTLLNVPEMEYNESETDWSDDEVEALLNWYLSNLDKFKNPKFDRSYLWLDAAAIMNKSPVVCSNKMSEIRSLYRNMVRENSAALDGWRFLGLCQKIYGTGRSK